MSSNDFSLFFLKVTHCRTSVPGENRMHVFVVFELKHIVVEQDWADPDDEDGVFCAALNHRYKKINKHGQAWQLKRA